MNIGAADAERGDPRAQRLRPVPGNGAIRNPERTVPEIELRVRMLEVHGWGNRAVLQTQDGLDQTSDAGGSVQVADVRLHRAHEHRAWLPSTAVRGVESGRQACQFHRVAEFSAGAVGLHIADLGRLDIRGGKRFRHYRGLTLHAGSGVARFPRTVVVHCRTRDHRSDTVAVPDRVRQPFQHDDTDAVTTHRAVRLLVEGPAVTVRREDSALLVAVTGALQPSNRDATGQADVALAVQQTLGGHVGRGQRRRACTLYVHARAMEVQLVRDQQRQEVLVVVSADLVTPDHVHQLRIRRDQRGVVVRAAASEHPDRSVVPVRHAAGVLQRVPGALQEEPVLGVDRPREHRYQAEELGVEQLLPFQRSTSGYEPGVRDQVRIHARGEQLLGVEETDGFDSVHQVRPELLDVPRARKASGEADHGHLSRVLLPRVRTHARTSTCQPVFIALPPARIAVHSLSDIPGPASRKESFGAGISGHQPGVARRNRGEFQWNRPGEANPTQ